MKRIFQILMTLALVTSLSCEDNLEINMEDTSEKKGNCISEVQVEIIDCGEFQITSSKDLSNIVYRVDGIDTKIESLDGHTYRLQVNDITDIWVKSGCNKSGDGPGYGEHFEVDDSEMCEPGDGFCVLDSDCNNLICEEGGICAASVGGRVFLDADGDGVFSLGDSGIENVGIFIQVPVGTDWIDFGFRASDPSGFYNFGILNATFTYRIRVFNAASYTFTTQNVGTDDTIDSDVDPITSFSHSTMPGPDNSDQTLWVGILPQP